jgi:hypothetical protein
MSTRIVTKLDLGTGAPIEQVQDVGFEPGREHDNPAVLAFLTRQEVEDEEPLVMVPLVEDEPDLVDQPPHYTAHPSGVECIEVTEHMSFCLGNAVKYIWRAGLKGDQVQDLQKAAWYLDREIGRLQGVLYRDTMGEDVA